MSEDEFTKIFKYLQGEFKKVDARFDEVNERFDKTQEQIDGLTKLIVDYNQEMLMLAHKVDRLERWVNQIAAKQGIVLT